jgi:GT2 family glycosyltransferase
MIPDEVALRVSVVVASHRSAYVNDLADALTRQTVTGHPGIEVIVVADYPVEEYQKRYPAIRWLFNPGKGIPAKRNAGCTAAAGEILAFIDDDCVPSQGWTGQGVAYLDNHKDAAGCEGRTVLESGALAAPVAEFRRLEKAGYRTNNIFYRKNVFESAGGFDARFTLQREDADLAFSVLSLGHTIGYCPDAIVTHRIRSNEKWDLLKNCVNRRFDPLLYKKHPVLYRKHIWSPMPPGIGLVMGFHALLLIVLSACIALWPFAAALDVSAALVLSVRRNRNGRNGIFWIGRDFISFLAAPFVIEGALIYGSMKYGKWLLF